MGAETESGDDGFILEPCDDSADDCDLLHAQDDCYCNNCGYGASGAVVARKLMHDAHMVECPTCRGKGVVAGPAK